MRPPDCEPEHAQALIVGNNQLLLRLVPGDGGWKITGRNVTDNRIRIASLKVDDSDGVGLAQCDISVRPSSLTATKTRSVPEPKKPPAIGTLRSIVRTTLPVFMSMTERLSLYALAT